MVEFEGTCGQRSSHDLRDVGPVQSLPWSDAPYTGPCRRPNDGREIPGGQRVIQEGDTGDRFYLIREGKVAVKKGPDQQTIVVLGPGDFFGEMALLTGQPRNASIDTLEPTIFYTLSKPDFQAAMAERATLEFEIRSSLFDR